MNCRALGALALALLVAACSSGGSASSSASSSPAGEAAASPAASNPIDFPLGQGTTVLSSHDFHATASGQSASGIEVIAQSNASLADLRSWLSDQTAKPPPGYTVAVSGSSVDEAQRHAQAMGLAFQVFSHAVGGKTHRLVVVVFDPATFDRKAGPILAVIGKYQMLPQGIRDSIDAQVKARTGYTMSELLDPSQPAGAAIAAAKSLESSGDRGVVLVDAAKD